ncbi:MAG: transglycosylase family protein, partial [Jatrophihabitantaceae bacterium]
MSRFSGPATSFFTDWRTANDREPSRQVDMTTLEPAQVTRARMLRRRRRVGLATLAAGATAATVLIPGSSATADPSASAWHRLRVCESSNDYRTNTGNGYFGAYQFDLATWRSVGGSGYPDRARPAEQDARALILYRMRGWQPWTCASILGLHGDGDAGSGRTGDINVSGGSSRPGPTDGVPAFPGARSYVFGDWNAQIKTFQDQMHRRGFFPVGTGQFGPNTLAHVKALQRLNGLRVSGLLGPKTWRLAWVGSYRAPTTPDRERPAPTAAIPPFPGARSYVFGDWNAQIKTFQDQM